MATPGKIIRAHRERRRLTELECAVLAGVPHQVWKDVENGGSPEDRVFAIFLDRFTDGDVSVASWASER